MKMSETKTKHSRFSEEGGDFIVSKLRELRNDENKLLCKADDVTGAIETEGPHKTIYIFNIPVGHTFTVIRGNTKSSIIRTSTKFIVKNQRIAA